MTDTSYTVNVTPSGQTVVAGSTRIDGEASTMLMNFWPRTQNEIKDMTPVEFKNQELPLARIKKIMKLDEDVKMISQEAPVVFARATEMFISELTLRSWIHTEENKRRTLQRNDIAMAISKYDQFDFLIDIVPRDELKPPKRPDDVTQRTSMLPDQVQYYFQLAQQHQAALSQGQQVNSTAQQPVQLQVVNPQPAVLQQSLPGVATPSMASDPSAQAQLVQVQAQPQQAQQVIHQIVTPSGEIQTVPIQLTAAQLQALQLQVQGQRPGQPIVLQTPGGGQTQVHPQPQESHQTPAMFSLQQLPFSPAGQQVVFQLPSSQGEDNQDPPDGSQ